MPISSDAVTGGAGSRQVLYESISTRIVRLEDASGGSLVCKEYLGPRAAQRLRNERTLLRRLAGIDGVAQLTGEAHGAGVLGLCDCGGKSLDAMLRASRFDTGTVLTLACQLARILAEVHRAGVIHRDINPANILVSAGCQAVLIDFDGAVLAAHQAPVEPDGQIVGTLGYMAPEQTGRTGRAVDQRSDLYALGATLYQMAVGRPPFEQDNALQMIHDHLVREPEPPWQVEAHVPRALSNIVMRLLAKAPEQRFQSADGLLHDLQRLRGEFEEGRGDVFELGEFDFTAWLAAPARLAGRDAELAMLHKAFADAMNTPGRMVLIGGPVGAGKSALINELRPIVAAAGGWFVYGKFDQYQRDGATVGALTQALRALGRLLLTLSGDEAAAQRQRILQSLGRNTGLITRASPEFALLLGAHADAPEIDPRQAELQFQQAMLDLLVAIASPQRPLVVVVDDLQWAGAFSLRFFERMVVDLELPGLLLVGSYRPEEGIAADVLAPMLVRWQQHSRPPTHIALANLDVAGMSEMIGQMLRLAPGRSRELAEALNVLTGGNPFDTVEMINALRGDGVLSLGEAGWQWDEVKVRRFIGRGNVVDLLAARISRLPAASRELLEFMSCLGSAVECKLLCAALGLSDEELRVRLRAPLEDGLLVTEQITAQGSVRFRHDRVQQAMLDAMDGPQRGQRQLSMARRLASETAFESEAAEQYLACAGMLEQPEEQRRAAHLFYGMAQKQAATASYMLAERYLAAAGGLLAAIDEPGDASLRHEIDVARHRALYSLGRVDEAGPLFAKIQRRARDPVELVEPTCLQIRSLDMQGRAGEALTMALRLLSQLGLHVPPDLDDPQRRQRLDALEEWVRQDSRLDHSQRAQTHDPHLLGIYKVLARISASAFHCKDLNAFTWATLEAQRLWTEHGPSAELMASMGNMCSVVMAERQDHRVAYLVASHVIAVSEALGFEVRAAGSRFTASWGTYVWVEPLENILDHVTRSAAIFQAKGDDPSFTSYFNIIRYIFLLDIGPDIETCETAIEEGLVLCRRTGNIHAAALHTLEQQFLRALRGKTNAPNSLDDEHFNEQAFMARMGRFPHVQSALVLYRGLHALLWGDIAGLASNGPMVGLTEADRLDSILYRRVYGHLFAALGRAWQLQHSDVSPSESAPLIAELESSRRWLAARAADQPYNFLHLLRLVEAEQAWALGDLWKAASTFDAAVIEAEARQRPWHRALITERAGLFNLARGLEGAGRNLLARARDHYQGWGATAKVDQMQREHAFLRAPTRGVTAQAAGGGNVVKSSGGVSPESLDLVGVLRASQALSSETSLERLTALVSEVLASLSGATKVLLLSCNEGQWSLLSHAPALQSIPVAQAAEQGLLPLSAFAYAERTGEALIVDDAAGDDRFARDPYFAGVPVCSLLLVPITGQGSARGMLLLENRLGRAAFNAQRLDAVMLIAGQLAVSLANAQLYTSEKVFDRTDPARNLPASTIVGARFGVRTANDKVGLTLYARNLFDKFSPTYRIGNLMAFATGDTRSYMQFVGPESRRVVGVSLDAKF